MNELFWRLFHIVFHLENVPNCEALNFEFQLLNVVSTFAYFVAAFFVFLFSSSDTQRIFAGLITLVGLGSLSHHIVPNVPTFLLDAGLALFVVVFAVYVIVTRSPTISPRQARIIAALVAIAVIAFFADFLYCPPTSVGFHFVWHLATATALYFVGRRLL